MMLRLLTLSAACLLLAACTTVQAGPRIQEIAADLSEGGSVIVLGKGFGNHSLRTEWLGGADGPIEKTATESFFNRKGWSVVPFPDKFRPVISRERAYSGKQAILFDSTAYRDGRIGIAYDPGVPVDFGYATWMAYIDTGGAEGQWKMFRMNWECNVKDTWPELVMFNWFGRVDSFSLRRQKEDLKGRFYPRGYPDDREWVRVELFLQPSSRPGKEDGAVEAWVHRPGKEITRIFSRDSLVTYAEEETRRWRHYVFQNFQGNGLGGHSRVWMDDIYIQDTRARVEIGNAPTWSGCSHREIQGPVAWSPERITFRFNPGRLLPEEEKYLYVIDAAGRVNQHGFTLSNKKSRP